MHIATSNSVSKMTELLPLHVFWLAVNGIKCIIVQWWKILWMCREVVNKSLKIIRFCPCFRETYFTHGLTWLSSWFSTHTSHTFIWVVFVRNQTYITRPTFSSKFCQTIILKSYNDKVISVIIVKIIKPYFL